MFYTKRPNLGVWQKRQRDSVAIVYTLLPSVHNVDTGVTDTSEHDRIWKELLHGLKTEEFSLKDLEKSIRTEDGKLGLDKIRPPYFYNKKEIDSFYTRGGYSSHTEQINNDKFAVFYYHDVGILWLAKWL